jgi:hypothetical protein
MPKFIAKTFLKMTNTLPRSTSSTILIIGMNINLASVKMPFKKATAKNRREK